MRMVKKKAEITNKFIRALIKKDQKAMEQLYKAYYGYAISVSLRFVLDRNIAEEVCNDAFMKVFNQIEKYDKKREFKSWFRQIVVNQSIDAIRKIQRDHQFEQLSMEDIPQGTFDRPLHYEDLLKILEYLPPMYRAVFNLYELEGYKHAEIADMLNIGESSSRTYLTRARQELQRKIQTDY